MEKEERFVSLASYKCKAVVRCSMFGLVQAPPPLYGSPTRLTRHRCYFVPGVAKQSEICGVRQAGRRYYNMRFHIEPPIICDYNLWNMYFNRIECIHV